MSLHSKTLFSSILTISLLLGLVPARAWAVTQEEINSARERRDAIRAERREKQASVDALTQEQAGVLERKAAMDARSASTQEQIRATQDEIELYRQRIEEKTAELAEAREREVDHGNGYVTLYGHLSAFAVSEGDAVSRGQTIGYVGSTGFSTGPHCHFEIWSNGGRIDPESFFSGLTFSPAAGE